MEYSSAVAGKIVLAAVSVGVTIVSIQVLYNIFIHPLRNFPGPKWWAASRVPWCYHQLRGRLHVRLLELHQQYGHTVRVAPGELSFTDGEAWRSIYGQRRDEMPKDPIFRLHTPTGAQNILVADRTTHTRHRRLLSHAFSESALREQEPVLQLYADKLLKQLADRCSDDDDPTQSIDAVAWLTFASFDLIGHMCFGENFGCLDSGEYAPFVKSIGAMASELTWTQICHYWRVMPLRRLLTPKALVGQRMRNIRSAMSTVQQRVKRGGSDVHRDFLHYILSANDEKGMSPAEINVNAFSLSIAGSESTATALSGALFLLLTHPHIYRDVLAEIRGGHADSTTVTLASTQQLPLLDAAITETLRLYPPVSIPMPRVVPAGGAQIAGAFVPAGVTVGVPHYSISRHPANFEAPDQFAPQRWLTTSKPDEAAETGASASSEYLHDHKEAAQPFSFGPRGCLGKNIARAELRLLLTKLLVRFDWRLDPNQEDWMANQKVQGFWQKPPLWCKVSPAGSS